MMERFFGMDFTSAPVNPSAILLSLLIAFATGQVIAWVYMITH